MKKPSKIRFAEEEMQITFETLNEGTSEEKELYKSIYKAFNALERNAFCGFQIPKKLIPKEYTIKFKIDNCWKYNLPNGWRLIYSVVDNREVFVISLILDWFSHKEYERKFGY